MIRAKLIPFSSKTDWDSLCKNFTSMRYTDNEARGVSVSRCDNTEIEGMFHEKIAYIERIQHPISGFFETERVSYHAVKFTLYRKHEALILFDPLRRISSLLSYLSQKLNHSFSVQDAKLDLYLFCKFASATISDFKVTRLLFPTFTIQDNTTANLTLSSSDDIFSVIDCLPFPVPSEISKMAFCGFYLGRKFSATATRAMSFTINHPDAPEFCRQIAFSWEELRAS